jgi:hypothetical protein
VSSIANLNPLSPTLEQLRDIHLPPPTSIWPIAPGWYFLLLVIVAGLYGFHRWYKRGRVKRLALVWLLRYEREYEAEGNCSETVLKISDLLRRVALVYFPRASVAGLHGKLWLDFLTQTSKKIDFNEVQSLFLELPYQKGQAAKDLKGANDLSPLFMKSRAWLKQRGGHV